MSEWIKKIDLTISNKLIDIFDFYVLHCPVSYSKEVKKEKVKVKVSNQGDYFKNYSSTEISALLRTMKKDINNDIYIIGDNNFKNKYNELCQKYSDLEFEFVNYIPNSDMGKTKTIFYSIRNSLAHGMFYIKKVKNINYYYLECAKDKKIKAQMRLKESTLLKWINRYNNKIIKEDSNNGNK